MPKPLIGFTYPTVTGENTPKGAAFGRIIADEFPRMSMWSVYYHGTSLPDWTGEQWFAPEHTGIRWYLLSFKTSDMAALGQRISEMPEHLRGRIMVFLHHEPDQWRSATDPRSDPSPDDWFDRQLAFEDMRETALWCHWIEHWACFTEDRFRTDNAFWMQNWGNRMLGEDSEIFDGVAWDIFNIGRSVVRSGSEMFAQTVDFNRAGDWTYLVREWGQVTPVDSPEDSQQVADSVRGHYEWLRDNASDITRGLVWYYNHNNTLGDPSGQRPGRPLTLAALQECLEDSLAPVTPAPDPNDPQYLLGYDAGFEARQGEVDSLTAEVGRLQNEVATARQQGRLQAFSEVATWAGQQI